MISRAIEKNKSLSITGLCSCAKVSSSGYYYWLKSPDFKLDDVDELINKIFYKYHQKYGYRSITMELKRRYDLTVNHKKVLKSMRLQGLKTKIRRQRYKNFAMTSYHTEKAFPNLINRDFKPKGPDRVYSADITELKVKTSQRVYLYAAKDLYSKEIVSYNISTSPDVPLVMKTYKKRLMSLPEKVREKLIYHTDQGSVFMSDNHIELSKSMGVKQSMSRKGNCLDNAPIESFFGHMKDEIDLTSCRYMKDVKLKVDEYMYYYNNIRPQWELKRKTPAECRGL